jgi:hypothetical protein
MAVVIFTKNRQRELSTSSLFFARSQVERHDHERKLVEKEKPQ